MKPALALLSAITLAACSEQPTAPLPKLTLDPARVAVAGFSSGAAMAQQVHLAYSDHLRGAALLGGPPYHCAEGKLDLALGRCIKAQPDAPDAVALAGLVRERAGKSLAPLSGLAGDRVLVLHGKRDALVAEAVSRAQHGLYAELAKDAPLSAEFDGAGDFAHVFPTQDAGGDCGTMASPFLGKCGVDVAGRMMAALFGAAPRDPTIAAGELRTFAQEDYAAKGRDALLHDTGYLYVPPRCAAGEACGLLIVFHGCEQNADAVGEAFVRDAGFNRWADVQDVVVLYPQTQSSYLPLNPKACWDWWGYTGTDYDTRDGAQPAWVANAAAALGAPLR
jgi:poly(3-hydroxybutyrate) depolymerase